MFFVFCGFWRDLKILFQPNSEANAEVPMMRDEPVSWLPSAEKVGGARLRESL